MTIMFYLHKDIIFPVGKTFVADSHQIVLFHYQTVIAQCLLSEWKQGTWLDLIEVTKMIPYTLHAIVCATDSQKYRPKLNCADNCSIFSGAKLL